MVANLASSIDSGRNIRNIFNTSLFFEHHVSSVCKSIFLELHRISYIRYLLSVAFTKQLKSAFVLSRLDYCNSLLISFWPGSILTSSREFRTMLPTLYPVRRRSTMLHHFCAISTGCQFEFASN